MGSSITSRVAKITFDYGSKRRRDFSWILHDKVTVEKDERSAYPIMTRYKNSTSTSYRIIPERNNMATLDPIGIPQNYTPSSGYTADYIDCYFIQTIRFAEGMISFQIKQNNNGSCDLSLTEVLDNNNKLVKSINFYVSRYNYQNRHTKLDRAVVK